MTPTANGILHWASTLETIAFLSAGAELYAAARALSEAKALKSLLGPGHWRRASRLLCFRGRSSRISRRAGRGKAGRLNTAGLLTQDALERRAFELGKVGGHHHPAGVPTKPVSHFLLHVSWT